VSTDQQRLADASYRGRLSELKVGVAMFKDHPVLGVGPGNYDFDYLKYNAIVGMDERHQQREAHNLFVQTAAETGLVGLAAFIYLLVTILWQTWRASIKFRNKGAVRLASVTWALEIGMGVYLLLSFFLHGAYFRHFMLLFALAALAVSLTPRAAPLARRRRASRRHEVETGGLLQPEHA
jgi:O-antigen ligase